MATIEVAPAHTNTPDEIIFVGGVRRAAEQVEVSTGKRVLYWFKSPFTIEGPFDASGMANAIATHERYRAENCWWERKTEVITTVTERL